MLLVPKSMSKQAKFASEMLLLLCVVAPLAGLLTGDGSVSVLPDLTFGESAQPFSLGNYLVSETERRVTEMASIAGIPADDVSVTLSETGYDIEEITLTLESFVPVDEEEAFRRTLSAYLSVPTDRVKFVTRETEQDSR
jgi:hypothetical protein